MAIYTVHAPPEGLSAAEAHDRTQLIREGFSWAALIFQPFWILWHRLWWVLAGWVAALVAIAVLARFSPGSAAVIQPLFLLWFAIVAADARRWTLERRGWRLVGVVHAGRAEEAERRWFDGMAASAEMTRRMAASPQPPAITTQRTVVPSGGNLPPVVGFTGARS